MIPDIAEIFRAGGVVMWPLLFTSLAIWFLIAWWWWQLRHEAAEIRTISRDIVRCFRTEGRAGCRALLKQRRGPFAVSLHRFLKGLHGTFSRGEYDAVFLETETRLSGPGVYLLALVKISPLLGLLGTVSGMIATFRVLHVFGIADPRSLSGGISCALLTTQAGLIIALPGLFSHHRLSRWSRTIHAELELARNELSLLLD